MNTRFFAARQHLAKAQRIEISIDEKSRVGLAEWLGRYYTRITLPDELVRRLKQSILPSIGKVLKARPTDGDSQFHNEVSSLHIDFHPDAELTDSEKYTVKIMILCDDAKSAEAIDGKLVDTLGGESTCLDGLTFELSVNSRDAVLLSDLDGYRRYTEWDQVSEMGEIAYINGGT